MRKTFIQCMLTSRGFGLSAIMLISLLSLLAPSAHSQNIAASEPVQWVGMPNGFSTVPYGGDYRTFGYRKISTTVSNPTDGRGQWATTINVQNSGGDIVPTNLAGGPGAGYLLISGPSFDRFQNKWNFNGIGQGAVNFVNNVVKQGGGQDMGINMSTAGRYTYVMRDAGYVNTEFYIGYTANAPVTVSRTGQSFNPSTYGSVISITTSAAPSTGENIYVRYRSTTNDFTTGTSVVQATGSGTSWSAEIPQQSCGATVYYYVYTSTRTLSQIGTDSESDRSLAALRYDDNSGNNYSYSVSPTPTAAITNNTGATELTCSLTSISVTATGGVSYSWDNGLGSGDTKSITAPGTYTVTVTGDNGCTATSQIIITQNITTPTAGITNNTGATELTCALTSISVTATGGVSYAWDNGLGSGDTKSITAPGTYTVTVTGANGCTSTAQIIITQNITSPTAGITNNTGTTILTCATTSISVTATGGVSYAWDNGLGSGDSKSITAPGTYTVTVTGANGCTATAQIIITQNLNIPGTPAPVQGISNVCPYIGSATLLTYSVPQDVNATSYQWIVPPTVTLVTGQGTNSIQVVINNGFIANANKLIRVSAQSSCGSSADRLFYLLAQLPTTPAPIVASTSNVCPSIGTNVPITYTIPKVAAATSYNWVAQAGTTTITHPNGPGVNDTTVTVTFSGSFSTSAITVSAVNDCNSSGTRSLLIVRGNPATPGLVSGPTNACEFIAPGGSAATYSVANVAGNTYTWTAVAGAIGLTGQGTNSISFTYPNGFTNGSISVQATNGCGVSGVRNLAIGKLNPATPSVIDVIQTGFCPDRVYTYTLSGMPSNATSIQWSVPPAAIGGFTVLSPISISVAYPATSVAGSVTATAVNNCGSSVARESLVKLPFCVFEFSGKGNNSTKETVTSTITDGLNVLVTPNPTTTNFKLQVNTNAKENIQVRVLDLQGRELKRMIAQPFQSIAIGNDLKAGTYIVETRQGQQVKTMRVIKF